MLTPERPKLGVNTALHRAMRTCPNWYWELGSALNNNKSRNLPVEQRATTDPVDGTVTGHLRSTSDQSSSDEDSSREHVVNSDIDNASRDCITCLDTDEVTIQTALKKYQKRV